MLQGVSELAQSLTTLGRADDDCQSPIVRESVMRAFNIADAASSFEELMTAFEAGYERDAFITKDGRPVAKLVPVGATVQKPRFVVAKGKLHISEDFLAPNVPVAKLFEDDSSTGPRP